jgi:hypothetical protein
MNYLALLDDDIISIISGYLKIHEMLCLVEAKGSCNESTIKLLTTRLSNHMTLCDDCKIPEFITGDEPTCWKCYAFLCDDCHFNNMTKCNKCLVYNHKTCMSTCNCG